MAGTQAHRLRAATTRARLGLHPDQELLPSILAMRGSVAAAQVGAV